MKNTTKPEIYAACLASYNNGRLYGKWIDATLEPSAILEEINNMLKHSPIINAEEWIILDYDNFGKMAGDEFEGIESIHQKANFIAQYGDLGVEVMAYYDDFDSAEEALNDHYHGEYGSELEFAIELFDDIYAHEMPEYLSYYIDYERFCYNIFINDYLSFDVNGSTHVFSYF